MSAAAVTPSQETVMNDISAKQNSAPMLDVLRAKCALYDSVRRLYVMQAWVTVGLPIVLSVLKLLYPEAAEVAVVGGLLLLGADLGWLDPKQKERRALAARAQEMFDVEVLSLPDHGYRTGPALDPETVARWARRHSSAVGLRKTPVAYLPDDASFDARVACRSYSVLSPVASTTSRSASAYGSGRSNAAFTSVKTAVFAPIPRASERTATAANTGLRA